MFGATPSGLDAILHRRSPSKWQEFCREPCIFLAKWIYNSRTIPCFNTSSNPIQVVCVSDTHNLRCTIPKGEILVHAGDITQSGSLKEFQEAIDWLDLLPHQHKILIGGNHDLLLDLHTSSNKEVTGEFIHWRSIIYLQNEAVTLTCSDGRQIKVYGSPWTPRHGNWAFQYHPTQNVWGGTVPEDTDILITHGPPKAHLDLGFGCKFLLDELWRIRPRLHVFGHIHAGYGQELIQFDDQQKIFEELIKAGGGIRWLLLLLYKRIVSMLNKATSSHTLLVNAAVVGGIRDEMKRSPTIIKI